MSYAKGLQLCVCVVLGLVCCTATAQPIEEQDGKIKLNFPENFELKALIDYVGERRGINFIYDVSHVGRRVTIKAPEPIPADSLMTLLESLLRMNGLVMTDTDVPNMRRIELAKNLAAVAKLPDGDAAPPEGDVQMPVSRIFELEHTTAERLQAVVQPFLSQPLASFVPLPEHEMVIVSDYADNMKKVEELVKLVDRPGRPVVFEFARIEHLEAQELAKQVAQLTAARQKAAGGPAAAGGGAVTVLPIERSNQLVVVGPADEVGQTLGLIESLDVSLGQTTRVYRFQVVSPQQVDDLVPKLIGEARAKRLYQSAVDDELNVLIATATPEIHDQIQAITQTLDRPLSDAQSPIRFYKLENAKAATVLETLRSIEGDGGLADVRLEGVEPAGGEGYEGIEGPTERDVNADVTAGLGAGLAGGQGGVNLGNSRILADEATNTIIVIAPPALHPMYEELIERLDVRRPQVLIEATIVTIDTTDGFSLGVEILRQGDLDDKGRYLTFSSFGLSQDVAPGDPGLTLTPGLGFNGVVLSSNIADVIVRALQSDSRAKVISRPSVLVNDNATASLVSENEEPFATVSVSGTGVERTTLGGYASAGTSIGVTPQIAEGDHLKLQYDIELSSFAEASEEAVAAASLPPARQTNTLSSEATIPDGHTIIVGGLTRDNYRESIDRVPILGSLPVVELLFSNRSTTERQTTLFVFIRAVILRDDQFQHLRFLSSEAATRAELAEGDPVSEPVEIP